MKDIKNDIKNNMNMTKARLYKSINANNQTRKKFKPIKNGKKKLLHTNSIKNHNRQFNLRHNTVKNISI
jgi:hypothetical protein